MFRGPLDPGGCRYLTGYLLTLRLTALGSWRPRLETTRSSRISAKTCW